MLHNALQPENDIEIKMFEHKELKHHQKVEHVRNVNTWRGCLYHCLR